MLHFFVKCWFQILRTQVHSLTRSKRVKNVPLGVALLATVPAIALVFVWVWPRNTAVLAGV